MRPLRFLALASIVAPLGVIAAACSSASAPDDTCAFIADTSNCYDDLTVAIDDCLTDVGETGGSSEGTLSSDGRSCSYQSGRTVTFGGDARTFEGGKTAVEFTVTVGGKTCVHVVDDTPSGGSFTVTGPDGRTFTETAIQGEANIVCPDGTQHHLSGQKLFTGACGQNVDLFALPGILTTGTGTSTVSGGLLGQKKNDYTCSIAQATP